MELFTYLHQHPVIFLTYIGTLGLLIGSFLNVVILRLPVMLERQWRQECQALASETDTTTQTVDKPFNLITPRSHCPQCNHPIKAWENIPVISYLFLRGRCASCHTPIPLRYPVTEILTGVLSLAVAWHFGPGWQTVAALLLTWALITLSIIDIDHQILPDNITLPFLWIGLALSLFNVFTDSHSAIIGALFGYLSLWSIFQIFRLLTGKEGMGYGDFKLLALLGAWLGWQHLLTIVLLSSLVGAIIGISMIVLRGHNRSIPIPFGPYLAIAGWIALLWGEDLFQFYLLWMGIT
jgi:leader peptidase (prepilin peptidase)/N-methyltransferase